MDSTANRFPPAVLERIRSKTFVERIEFRPTIASTNDLALELISQQDHDFETPTLVLTPQQTAGRGRGPNRWWSSPGGLTFSLILDRTASNLSVDRWQVVSLIASLAVCEVLEERLPTHKIGLKWPNDVYLQNRKVSGILLETVARQSGKLVVGIGINVNNSFADAPTELRDTATSLVDVTQKEHDLTEILITLLRSFENRLSLLSVDRLALPKLWNSRCLLRGHRVQVAAGRQQSTGLCRGIDDQGALLLETASGLKRCVSGTVTQCD